MNVYRFLHSTLFLKVIFGMAEATFEGLALFDRKSLLCYFEG